MAMADSTTAENHWTGMGDVSDPAPHACEPVPASRHRSKARCRSTGPWARCESRRLYGGGAGDPTTRRGGTGSFAGESFVSIIARLPSQPREDTVNEILIPCPKCRVPGILYLERSIDARIGGSKHIAHVLHASMPENRRMCLRTRSEFKRIGRRPAKGEPQ